MNFLNCRNKKYQNWSEDSMVVNITQKWYNFDGFVMKNTKRS